MIPFAIQLYSVRDHWAKDFQATYAALKEAGYDYIELFAIGPNQAAKHGQMLNAAGLKPISTHIDYETLTEDPGAIIGLAERLGIEFIVMPWLELDTAEAWRDAAKRLDDIGAQLREAGVQLGYHNHGHEFRDFGGRTAFEIIVSTAAPENLFIELDFYWAQEGGVDAFALLESLGPRCPLLHLKDKPASGPIPFTEIGNGTTDWPRVFKTAREAGVKWHIVEQDESEGDSLESAAISARFIQDIE